ncbi:MAG: hypothetical protein ACYS6W_11935 [Planctomycetota bacterium]
MQNRRWSKYFFTAAATAFRHVNILNNHEHPPTRPSGAGLDYPTHSNLLSLLDLQQTKDWPQGIRQVIGTN